MYKKNVTHVQSCCFANKTYCFFWCTVTAKTSKTNGCFLLLRKNIVGSLCVLLAESFVLRHLVFVPLRNTKKLPNKQKQLIKTKTRSHAKTKASLADIFPFPLNTELGPRLPSWKCVPQPFRPRSPAQSKWRIGNLKKPPGFEKDWRFRFNLVNSLWSGR